LQHTRPTGTFLQGALNPYSKALLAAAPKLYERNYRPGSSALQGETLSPYHIYHIPSGCRFHTRSPYVMEVCRQVEPALIEIGPDHQAACHLYPKPGEN
jgi:peptide/nickel transport system ATP-binding protein